MIIGVATKRKTKFKLNLEIEGFLLQWLWDCSHRVTSSASVSSNRKLVFSSLVWHLRSRVLSVSNVFFKAFQINSQHDVISGSHRRFKFLTAVTGLIVASPTTNPLMSTLASCCLVPICINSILLSFTLSLSLIIQHLMALLQRSIASTALL